MMVVECIREMEEKERHEKARGKWKMKRKEFFERGEISVRESVSGEKD